MRVAMVSHMWPSPGDELHGIFVEQLVHAIGQEGIDIRVIAPVPWTPSILARRHAKWAGYRSVQQRPPFPEIARPSFVSYPAERRLASYPQRFVRATKRVLKDWRTQGWYPDIFHAHTAAQAGISLARYFTEPLVITTHGRDLHQLWFNGTAVQKNIREAYALATARIWVSDHLRKKAIDLQAIKTEAKDHVIYSGIGDVPNLSAAIDQDGIRVGFVSRLIEGKGIPVLLEALAHLAQSGKSVSLQAAGDGPLREQLEERAKQLNVPATWYGSCPTYKAFSCLQGCNMFVLPSLAEGFGLVFLEAMKAGLPVIGTTGTGFAELVNDGHNAILVPQNDPAALADAIEKMGTNAALRSSLATQAGQLVGQRFSWQYSAQEHIRLYKSIL